MTRARDELSGADDSGAGPRPTPRPPAIARPCPAPLASSPRIERLERELARSGAAAVTEFWNEIGDSGSPVLEDAGHRGEVIATFLWRDRGGTRAVLALVNKLTDRQNLAASLMRNVAGTDVWWLSYRLPSDWRGSYHLVPDDSLAGPRCDPASTEYPRELAHCRPTPDPRNPERLPQPAGTPEKSVARMPDAPTQPYVAQREGIATGTVVEHPFTSSALDNQRRIWTYLPHGYDRSARYPLLVLLDGDIWCHTMPIAPTLDNMIEQGAIPPLVMVAIDALDAATRARELACHTPFSHFVTAELLPWVRSRWSVTDDPERTVVAGQSLGGLAATFLAHRAPQRFGAVLAQSGSFWWRGPEDDNGIEWLTRRYMRSPRLPLRFYLEVGSDEWVNLRPTRLFASVLGAMGYPAEYQEFSGGHDRACWRGGIADGLVALTRDW